MSFVGKTVIFVIQFQPVAQVTRVNPEVTHPKTE